MSVTVEFVSWCVVKEKSCLSALVMGTVRIDVSIWPEYFNTCSYQMTWYDDQGKLVESNVYHCTRSTAKHKQHRRRAAAEHAPPEHKQHRGRRYWCSTSRWLRIPLRKQLRRWLVVFKAIKQKR